MNTFNDFKNWINGKTKEWNLNGIIIDEIIESTHAHQIHINLHSERGFGHIGLYESNKIYWIEFEAVCSESGDFYRYLEFDKLPDLDGIEKEYLIFLH